MTRRHADTKHTRLPVLKSGNSPSGLPYDDATRPTQASAGIVISIKERHNINKHAARSSDCYSAPDIRISVLKICWHFPTVCG